MMTKRTPRWLLTGLLVSPPLACDFEFEDKDDGGYDDDGDDDDGDHDDDDDDDDDGHDDGECGESDGGESDGGESDGGESDGGGMETGGDACGLGPVPPPDPALMDGLVPNPGAPVITDCDLPSGYDVDSWRAISEGATRLWVGGVYQTRSDHSGGYHPTGEGTVTWSTPGSNVLVLSSYEPTHWTIDVLPGGQLDRIVTLGYHVQTVDAPPGVLVETYDYESGDCLYECGFALPGDGGGCEGEDLVAAAQHVTGLDLYAFDGCYDATTFVYGP